MSITAWAQDVDYGSVEHGRVTVERAEGLVRGYEWAAKGRAFATGEQAGEDVCPAGIGFNGPKSTLFHMYVLDENMREIHVILTNRKILGLFPVGRSKYIVPVEDMRQAIDLLRLFFHDHAQLKMRLEGA